MGFNRGNTVLALGPEKYHPQKTHFWKGTEELERFPPAYAEQNEAFEEYLQNRSLAPSRHQLALRNSLGAQELAERGCLGLDSAPCVRKKAKERAAHPVQKKLPSMDRAYTACAGYSGLIPGKISGAMKTLLARLFDCGDDACCFSFLKGRARHFYADDGNAGHLRLRSEPDLDSPGSNSPMVRRSRTWSASQFTKNFRHLQRMMSSPKLGFAKRGLRGESRKRLKADELDFGQLSLHDRATSIMDLWKIRGQYRPITAFYDFERKLGEGAFGSVAKWRIKGSQQQVAVKRTPGAAADAAVVGIKWRAIWHGFFRNRAAEKAIRKELKLLLVLDNPFIIKFREWFEDLFKGIFFVMELCSGPHFREVTYAISYLHGMDPPVVHRDLKPENILLADATEHSTARLIDFGLASLKTDQEEHLAVGTMVFMAPETFTDVKAQLDQQTDIWALGVIFTWIVTALELGSLQHPCLEPEDGEEFNVRWIDLYNAFRDRVPWNRALIASYPTVGSILDKVLVYQPSARCGAAAILQDGSTVHPSQDPWMSVSDPAISASAELLERGSLLYNLRTFGELTNLEKKIVSLVADHAPDAKLELLRRRGGTFRAFDTSKQGVLDVSELIEGFRRHDVDISEDLIRDLFDSVDIDHNHVISYQEWLAATIGPGILDSEPRAGVTGRRSWRSVKVKGGEAALGACFRRLDPEANGVITRDDLIRAVGEEGADEVFAIDEDSFFAADNISYEEFKVMAQKIGAKRASTTIKTRQSRSMVVDDARLRARAEAERGARPKRNSAFAVA
eukprot:g2472.t1